MSALLHISATCSISKGTVCKNGLPLFIADDLDLPAFLQSVYKHLGSSYQRFYKMDSLSKLGWLASEVLLTDSFGKENYLPLQTGMVFANANASLDTDVKYMASVAGIPSPSLFVYTLPNIMCGEISIRNNFKGETAFFIAEDFDTVFMAQYVTNLFNYSFLKACLCGWVDLLGNDYKAVLFLVEQGPGELPFDSETMNKVFNMTSN